MRTSESVSGVSRFVNLPSFFTVAFSFCLSILLIAYHFFLVLLFYVIALTYYPGNHPILLVSFCHDIYSGNTVTRIQDLVLKKLILARILFTRTLDCFSGPKTLHAGLDYDPNV